MEAIAFLLSITTAEVVNAILVQPLWGMIIHIGILVAAIIRSARTDDKYRQQLFLSVALVPLIRIISLSMPLTNIPQILWYPTIYGPLVVSAVAFLHLPLAALGGNNLFISVIPPMSKTTTISIINQTLIKPCLIIAINVPSTLYYLLHYYNR